MSDQFHGQSPGSQDFLSQVSDLEKFLNERLKGQPKAIHSICSAYEDSITLAKLDDGTDEYPGPISVLLFLGPSGVGKTEIARLLAEYFNGRKRAMVKIPCAGFSQSHMVHTIIGAPHSFVGFDKPPPILSKEYIDKKIKVDKILTPASLELSPLLAQEKELINKIKSYQQGIAILCEKIKHDIHFFYFLKEFGDLPLARSFDEEIISNLAGYKEMDEELKKLDKKLLYLRREIDDKKSREIPISEGTESLSLDPFVVLFDEIEKGNITLHNLLLEIMEDGKATLANGTVTDLSNTVIILTSNIGATKISNLRKKKIFGFAGPKKLDQDNFSEEDFEQLEKDIWKIAKAEMEKTFSPEFINRLDKVVVFRPLAPVNYLEILDFYIESLQSFLSAKFANLKLEISREVKDFIVKESLDHPELGARLLRRKFKSFIKRPLGRLLVKRGKIGRVIFRIEADNVVMSYN